MAAVALTAHGCRDERRTRDAHRLGRRVDPFRRLVRTKKLNLATRAGSSSIDAGSVKMCRTRRPRPYCATPAARRLRGHVRMPTARLDRRIATRSRARLSSLLDTLLKAGASRRTRSVRADAHHEPDKGVGGRADGTDEGQDARIIKSAAQTFKYQKSAAPRASLEDPQRRRLDRQPPGRRADPPRARRAELRARQRLLLPPADDLERLRAAAVRPGAPELARARRNGGARRATGRRASTCTPSARRSRWRRMPTPTR